MNDKELRELNAWIAEHVMGWTKWTFSNGFTKHNYLNAYPKERANKFRTPGWIDGIPTIDNWHKYTTDPSAAMDVLKKCAEKQGDDIVITFQDGTWTVAWVDWNAEERADRVKAPTLELAICLYAKNEFSKPITK